MSQLPSSLRGLEYFTRDEAVEILNARVKDGTISGYRFEGDDVYLDLIKPIEHITINIIFENKIL